jgi:glutathione S-transferase
MSDKSSAIDLSPAIKLYGHPDSGHALKVALALALAGIPAQMVWVDIWAEAHTRPEEFLAASPFAEVPLLLIDNVAHVQSGAILLEIAVRFRCLGGEHHDGLKRGRELLMWEANRIGMCLPQLKEARRPGGAKFPAEAVEWLTRRYEADCQRFESLLGNAAFFHGDAPGIGDCAIWGYTQWLDDAGVSSTPVMEAWLGRMRALPQNRPPAAVFPAQA